MPRSKHRKTRKPAGGGGSGGGGGGLMAMRSGFKSFMGNSDKGRKPTAMSRVVDAAIWVAVLVLLVLMAYRRFG